MTRLFVYGTLRKNGTNYWRLAGCKCLAEKVWLPGYALHDNFLYPYAVPSRTPGAGIVGEVYEIDEPTLAQLDRLEGLDGGHYRRVVDPTIGAFIYLKADVGDLAQYPAIPGGDWQPETRPQTRYAPDLEEE
jgi:gamma-glutamylcyclotransferase (GGCT)/AIG2-like uncharacterized protein YtfP